MTLNWKPVMLSLLQHLEAQGLMPYVVHNGEERIATWSDDLDDRREEIAEELCAVDLARLVCESGPHVANLWLLLGNEPEELVADWNCTPDPALEQRVIHALVSFEDDWAGIPCPTENCPVPRHLPYKIIRRGSVFTAAGPSPDKVLSQHYNLETAQRAFVRISGPAILVGPGNIQLDHRIL